MPIGLIVKADEPALFFSSIESAVRYLEAIDVRDGVYPAAYGPRGEPYVIGVAGDRVVIEQLEGELRAGELRDLLKNFLAVVGANAEGDLTDLITACEKYIAE